MLADEGVNYATREYIVSEFVKAIGRSTLEESDAILEMFFDIEEGDAMYVAPEHRLKLW